MFEESAVFNPNRLALARMRRGLTVAALARSLGVTPRTVTRWESGDSQPSDETAGQLARVLGFPVSFFAAPDVAELPLGSVSFRALSKTSAGMRHSAVSAGRVAVLISDWIDCHFRLPSPNVPTLSGYDPETAAAALRERWGLGSRPIGNMVHLLEANGVRVLSLSSDLSAVDAFSFYADGRPFALVNTTKTGERQRFDLAHELGHLVMHGEHHSVAGREAESQAQRFAGALLMPREDVMAQPLWNADIERILAAKSRWRVAAMALKHRLRELEMLTEWGYRDACVLLSQAGYRRSEPRSPVIPETSQVLGKVFRSLREGGISGRGVAAELHLTEQELQEFVFGLVPISIEGAGQGSRGRADLRLIGR
jgi:Zn-dependent peptidase ImmA (M78 family)/DNA-binding XRE family transcriptional regulator